jgi:membrane protein implicated in regulation of membrane protease activity
MDESKRERFKWKFYSLTILLNLIILIVAGAVISYFLVPVPFGFILALLLALVAIVMLVYFRRRYHETKEWLGENP